MVGTMSIGELPGRPAGAAKAHRPPLRHWTLAFAAAGAVAAALAAGVAALLHSGTTAPSPLSAVTRALAQTSTDSYTFSLDKTAHFGGRTLNSDVVSGAFDPRHDRGTELLTTRSAGRAERAQVRFIGAYLYTWVPPGSGFSKPWDKSPATAAGDRTPPGGLYGFASDQPVSPAALTVVLRAPGASAHVVGPVSGPGWTGTKYSFIARLYDGRESVSGTAYLDQLGRIRRLMTITTERGARATEKALLTTRRDITFANFGASVPASAPPASQTKYTSGEPYWGFYF
jgi:hypothetical protein